MSVTAGAISLSSKTATSVNLAVSAATGGMGPYTYQWYRSTTSGFSPGGGNILSGETALTLEDDGLIPGTQYYYKNVATDTGASNATDTSAQLGVQTDPQAQSQNQFSQSVITGMMDLAYNPDTISAQIDTSETGTLYPGQAVKVVDSAGGVPKVVACSADSDGVFGFIAYNLKNRSYVAGQACELAQDLNVIYLMATAAIARGAQVLSDVSTVGGVAPYSASGASYVGWAVDKASAAGQLIRVKLNCPSFAVGA